MNLWVLVMVSILFHGNWHFDLWYLHFMENDLNKSPSCQDSCPVTEDGSKLCYFTVYKMGCIDYYCIPRNISKITHTTGQIFIYLLAGTASMICCCWHSHKAFRAIRVSGIHSALRVFPRLLVHNCNLSYSREALCYKISEFIKMIWWHPHW